MHVRNPDYPSFAELYQAKRPQVLSITLENDLETPVSLYLKLARQTPYSFLFESVEKGHIRGRYSVIGFDPQRLWQRTDTGSALVQHKDLATGHRQQVHRATSPEAVRRSLADFIADHQAHVPEGLPSVVAGVFGYLGYESSDLHESLTFANPDALDIPLASLMSPRAVVVHDGLQDKLHFATLVFPSDTQTPEQAYAQGYDYLESLLERLSAPLPVTTQALVPVGEEQVTSNRTPEEFKDAVNKAKEYILAGDIFQVVLSQRFQRRFTADSFAYYRQLRRLNPSPYLFYVNFEGYQLIGSSPEIMARLNGDTLSVRPIAGTRPRGKTVAEDQAHAASLLADPKECAEHLMLLDLGRNDVARVTQADTVKAVERFVIEYYSHVMHIVSTVQGRLLPGVSALDAFFATFPVGTVSGAPKIRAMEIIDELEPEQRRFYAGAVGYFAANGDMDTCIALRTALIKDNTLYVQAGAGIVADSDPESEYQETCNKARALLKAAELTPL